MVCVFPDASLRFWGAIVTQVPMNQLSLSIDSQDHEPLAFLSGPFRGSQMAWSIIEKEAFSIVETCKRMDFLLLRPNGFKLYTDHRNLTFLYDPHSCSRDVARYTAEKVQRWGLVMMGFNYTIHHIDGEDNVWADLLSRWGAQHIPPSVQALHVIPSNPSPFLDEDFVWPSVDEIIALQDKALVEHPQLVEKDPTCPDVLTTHRPYCSSEGRMWIPSCDPGSNTITNIKIRIMVLGHCGTAGHRGLEMTLKVVSERFTWCDLIKDVKLFCSQCFHCQKLASGTMVPVPLGSEIHASRPNEVLHFDFFYMGPSDTGDMYVCILKDDHSMCLQGTNHPSADGLFCPPLMVQLVRYSPYLDIRSGFSFQKPLRS
ncbi:hypothetical protein AeRB84_018060 [Aphanomyces euteiches]|nr:hypothetical protein AeRB84_018060 [Aphanomyces euteiches]